jgi:DNA-binding transcriptional MerR regulator
MSWSTRELAEVAGTTLKTVRHYHRIGLLEEPERASNGYKQYDVRHLVQLLRIRRLVDLGLSLSTIREMGTEADGNVHSAGSAGSTGTTGSDALRALDAELAQSIVRQQRMREDIAEILAHGGAPDLPAGFAVLEGAIDEPDRALLLIYARVLEPEVLEKVREMLADPDRPEEATVFRDLPADAGEDVREELARAYAPKVRALMHAHGLSRGIRTAGANSEALGTALRELYNPAQIDVLVRMGPLVTEADPGGGPTAGT